MKVAFRKVAIERYRVEIYLEIYPLWTDGA